MMKLLPNYKYKYKYKCVAVYVLGRRLYKATKCCRPKKIEKEEQKEERERKIVVVIE